MTSFLPGPMPPPYPTFGQTVTNADGLAVAISVRQPYRTLAGAAVGSPPPPPSPSSTSSCRTAMRTSTPWHWLSLSLQSGSVEEEQVVDLRYGIGAMPRTRCYPGGAVCFGLHDPKDLGRRVAVGDEQWDLIFTS